MAKRLLKRYGLWVLGGIIVAFLSTGFLLLPDALGGKIVSPIDEPAFDTELYKSMLSKLVADETELIDQFNADDLVSCWWNLLVTTNGSNTVTYTDTGSGSSDVELRFYRAGDGDTDTDSDGYADARELLMSHSDPDDEDS